MQKLPINNFQWIENTSQFNQGFIKGYNGESNERYFLEVEIQYPEWLHELHNDLPFLPERIKIEKVEELVTDLHNKTIYYSHKKFNARIKSWINFEKSS